MACQRGLGYAVIFISVIAGQFCTGGGSKCGATEEILVCCRFQSISTDNKTIAVSPVETWLLKRMQRRNANTWPKRFSQRYVCCRGQGLAFVLRWRRRNRKRSRGVRMIPMARIIGGMLTTRLVRSHGWRWRRGTPLLPSPSLLGPSSRQTVVYPRGRSWWGRKNNIMRCITGWRARWWWGQGYHMILLLRR